MKECLSDETVAAYVDSRLNDQDRRLVESHLLKCDRCLEQIALLKQVTDACARGEEVSIPERVLARADALITERCRPSVLDVVFGFTRDLVSILRTTGEVFSGPIVHPVPVRGPGRPARRALVRKTVAKYDLMVEVESSTPHPVVRIILRESESQEPIHGTRVKLTGPSGTETRFTEEGLADFGPREPAHYRIEIEGVGDVDLEITPTE